MQVSPWGINRNNYSGIRPTVISRKHIDSHAEDEVYMVMAQENVGFLENEASKACDGQVNDCEATK